MEIFHMKPIVKYKNGWIGDPAQRALRWSSDTLDWMMAVQDVCCHPISCLTDSPSQAIALRFARSAEGASSPALLIQKLVRAKTYQRCQGCRHVCHLWTRVAKTPSKLKSLKVCKTLHICNLEQIEAVVCKLYKRRGSTQSTKKP